MHGTAPLLRSVANVVTHTTSKIPHIRYHIALRQTRSQQRQHDGFKTPIQSRRCQSSFAATRYFDRTVDQGENTVDTSQWQAVETKSQEDVTHDDLTMSLTEMTTALQNVNMFDILEEGFRDRILTALMSNWTGTPFIRQVDDQIYNKALQALEPEYFIEPFRDLARHVRGHRPTNQLKTRTFDDRLATFAAYLDRMVAVRRETGKKLDLDACKHLLRCAASMGDAQLAKSVFLDIMPEDGIEPDLESHNYYCQALVWSHAFSSEENYNLRVIPRHLQIRATRNPPKSLSGHSTSSKFRARHATKSATETTGIREQVLDLFRQCMDKGFTANELTFTNLMIAMGREGDLEGVKSILKSVWNVNVDLLGVFDEEEIESPTFYEEDHHLRPSHELLFTVAHIFGSNNDLRTAWLLVDFISRNYNIEMTERVWFHLCEWALVLSLRRSGSERAQQRNSGQVPQQTLVQLVEAMTDYPHNIKPNAVTHYLLSRSWVDKKHLDNALFHVGELKDIVNQQHSRMELLMIQVVKYAKAAFKQNDPNVFANEAFYKLRRQFSIEYMDFQRNIQLINVAVNRHILSETDWSGSGKLTDWERRGLPEAVSKFSEYLPNRLNYPTQTGKVELLTVYQKRGEIYSKHKMDYRVLPIIFNALDTDDQARLNRRMKVLVKVVLKDKEYCFNCETLGHNHLECPNDSFAPNWYDPGATDSALSDNSGDDGDILVLNPNIPKQLIPQELRPASTEEFSNPRLPFE